MGGGAGRRRGVAFGHKTEVMDIDVGHPIIKMAAQGILAHGGAVGRTDTGEGEFLKGDIDV